MPFKILLVVHDFSSYKKRLYKKRLVDLFGCRRSTAPPWLDVIGNVAMYVCKLSLHAVSSYKKRLYKKRLVDFLGCKKRRLVNILTAKKRVSQFFHLSWPIFVIFSKILSVFSKIALFSLKLTLFKEILRNGDRIKWEK